MLNKENENVELLDQDLQIDEINAAVEVKTDAFEEPDFAERLELLWNASKD